MRINDVFTNDSNDTIIKIDGVYFQYNIRENKLSAYKGVVFDKLEKTVYLGLSSLQVNGDLPLTLEQELKDPVYNTSNIQAMNKTVHIKNYYLEENPNIDLLLDLNQDFSIQVKVRKKAIHSSNVVRRSTVLNKIPIPAIAFVEEENSTKEIPCSVVIGGFKEG